ncbi:MATE family efflux transporter [uncultured Oscillibacter sp.]|uniref:MATE family efflux transporter n=1 Tax=uncultured Oscillibacter sp. TaxID=876091 RepID=UPI0025E4BDC2|nr:MATE family efflux transporter [uncultured Oscillibacter sp.]
MEQGKQFVKFVVPSIVSMWIFSLYTIVDGIFVARGVGEAALASVNLSIPYVQCIFAVGLLFGTGTSTVVAICLGRGEQKKALQYFNQNLFLLICFSLCLTAFTLLELEPIARFLGASGDTLNYTMEYVRTISVFAVFFIVSYNLEVLVKTNGAPHVSAIGVASCGIMNVLLDYVFVMHFHWGIRGAAFATGLSQLTSTAVFVCYFLRHREKLHFGRFSFDLSIYRRILPIGLADGMTELSAGITTFLFNQMILRVIGSVGIVSYTIVSYVNTLVLMTMTGLTQGMQPLVSYHYGREQPQVYLRFLRDGLVVSSCLAVLSFVLVLLGADRITGIFIKDPDSALFRYSAHALRVYARAFLLMGANVVMAGFFAAVERPRYSLAISLGRGLVIITLSLLLMAALFGEAGIWNSPLVSEALCLVVTGLLARRHFRQERLRT